MQIRLKFGEVMTARGITPNRLARTQGINRNTIYALSKVSEDRNRVDLDVLANAMEALERETGLPVTLSDVFELYIPPTPEQIAQMEAEKRLELETQAWFNANLVPELEPFDWGEDGPPKGQTVQVVDGMWVVVSGQDGE